MRCSICSAPTRVLDSRPADDGLAVRRRRECEHCGERFTTKELADMGATELERAVVVFIRGLDTPVTGGVA